jgi:hypothetical protein
MRTRECAECGKQFHWQPPGRAPMTCSPACQLARKNRQSEQSRQRAAKRGCPPDKHGTSTGYSHYKCSCTKCSKWARQYKAQRRRALKAHN